MLSLYLSSIIYEPLHALQLCLEYCVALCLNMTLPVTNCSRTSHVLPEWSLIAALRQSLHLVSSARLTYSWHYHRRLQVLGAKPKVTVVEFNLGMRTYQVCDCLLAVVIRRDCDAATHT